MTDEFSNMQFSDAPQPEHVVPNHKASSDSPTRERVGIFARRDNGEKEKPKSRAPRAPKVRTVVPNKPGQFVEPLMQMYAMGGMALMPFDAETAMVIMGQAEKCATALDEAAQRNEGLRRMLFGLTTASVWGAVVAAHAPILVVLLKNHTPILSNMEKKADAPLGDMVEGWLKSQTGPETSASE